MLETNEHEDEQGGQQTGEEAQARWKIDLGLVEVYRGHAVGFRVCVLTTDLGSRFYKLIACLIIKTYSHILVT